MPGLSEEEVIIGFGDAPSGVAEGNMTEGDGSGDYVAQGGHIRTQRRDNSICSTYGHYQNWEVLQRPGDIIPRGDVVRLELREGLLRHGCQFYSEKEGGRDSLMYQRLALVEYLTTRASKGGKGSQADHIILLARESFDLVRQVVSASEFDVFHADFYLKHTCWARIIELYRSLRLIQATDKQLRGSGKKDSDCYRQWPMLANNVPFDGDDRHLLPGEEGWAPSADKRDVAHRMGQVLTFVCNVLRMMIPAHVFILGAVPNDEELKYFGFQGREGRSLTRRCLYEVFSTELAQRSAAVKSVADTLNDMKIHGAECDEKDIASCRELGFRVHSMLVNMLNSKERAVRCCEDNESFLEALRSVCSRAGGDALLGHVSNVLVAITEIGTKSLWKQNFDDSMLEFRKQCNNPESPSPVPTNEACSHFVNGVLMTDEKDRIAGKDGLAAALVNDRRRLSPTAGAQSVEKLHEGVFSTTLVLDVAIVSAKNQGLHVVAGERQHKVRQALATTLTTILVQLQKCSSTLEPTLTEAAEDEPSIPLPGGRLYQTVYRVDSHLQGACSIVDLGFRSDGCYKVEQRQGLVTIEFYPEDGPTLADAIFEICSMRRPGVAVKVVRLEGSALIDRIRCSVTIACRREADTRHLLYDTYVDGENISKDNPVKVVIATDDTDATTGSDAIPFFRIAQYVSGTTWRKDDIREPIADKAVQVGAAFEVECEMREIGDSYTRNFDVMNSVVYQSSKQLLDHFDNLRQLIVRKWSEFLQRNKYQTLAKLLEDLLIGNARVLAMSKRELVLAKMMLDEIHFSVNEVQVDNLSFVAKRSSLEERSKKPSISFTHIELVGHLDTTNIERICALVAGSSLRLLVVASPSSQHFGKITSVLQTPSAAEEFRSSRVVALGAAVSMDAERFTSFANARSSSLVATRRFSEACGAHFYTWLKRSSAVNKLTIVCRRGQSLRVPLDVEGDLLDLSAALNPVGAVRECFERSTATLVAVMENPHYPLALFVYNEHVVNTNILYAPINLDLAAGPLLTSLLGLDASTVLSPEWTNVQEKMQLRRGCVHFVDFVCLIPECEWLDHRSRVQLYFLTVWDVPLDLTKAVLPTIRNVSSLPLQSTLLVAKDALKHRNGELVEAIPSYSEMVVEGAVTLDDVLRTSIATRVDIPWNICTAAWSTAAPFSSAVLTQILSVYPFRLRLLVALGPSLFHTLSGVELFANGVPLSWAMEVAERMETATELLQQGLLPREHLAALSVVKWLFLSRGWNDAKESLLEGQHLKRARIRFDAGDFAALDKEGLVMDILEAQHGDPRSKRAAMSSDTRYEIADMLATIEGSPTLFTKQPQILDYFLRAPEDGGITAASAKKLFGNLLDPKSSRCIGAPFLSVIKDSTLSQFSGLRHVNEVNYLWLWCNGESCDEESKLAPILGKLSCQGWAFLLAASPVNKLDALLRIFSTSHGRDLTLGAVLEALSALTEVPSAGVVVTTVILKNPDRLEECRGQQHLFQVLRAVKEGRPISNPMMFALPAADGDSLQFKVELEGDDKLLTYSLLQLSLFDSNGDDTIFSAAVLFFGRCLSDAGRRHMLRTLAELLIDSSSAPPIGLPRPNSHSVELAAAALWLHVPLSPCPLTVNANAALKKMKMFLSSEFTRRNVSLPQWTDETTLPALHQLSNISNTFRHVIEVEYEVVPYLALALIGWNEFLPQSYLQSLVDVKLIDTVTPELVTIIVNQGTQWPTYELSYSIRHLPAEVASDLFKPEQYVISDTTPASFDVSHGVSKELICQNLSFFAHQQTTLDGGGKTVNWGEVDMTAPRLCILLWFQCLGLFANITDPLERLAKLVAPVSSGRMEDGVKHFKLTLERCKAKLAKETVVVCATLPSFMGLHVCRRSALLAMFDYSSVEAVLYTLQALSTVLTILPPESERPVGMFLHDGNKPYRGDTYLANLVLREPHDRRSQRLNECFRVISCEIGYRLGQAWPMLDQRRRQSVAQSVANVPFSLLADFPQKASEMLLMIVDVALEQKGMLVGTAGDKVRLTLFSSIVMAVGFQDHAAKEYLLYPLLLLLENTAAVPRLDYTGILIHTRTSIPGKTWRSTLTRRVAREIVYWRNTKVLATVAPWLTQSVADNFPDVKFGDAKEYIVGLTPKTETAEIRRRERRPSAKQITKPVSAGKVALFRDSGHDKRDPISQESESTQQTSSPSKGVPPARGVAFRSSTAYASTVIDVSTIMEVEVPNNSIITGGRLRVRAGLGCALIREKSDQLRIVAQNDIRDYPASTICCFFEDYGEAWEHCNARKHPSTLVGSGFMLASSPKGGWRVTIGLAHNVGSDSMRPWHVLAFHNVLGLPLHGPAEDREAVGGASLLLNWMCSRVCQGLAWDLRDQPDVDSNEARVQHVNTTQELVNALVTSENAEGCKRYYDALIAFLADIATSLKPTSIGSNLTKLVVEGDIHKSFCALDEQVQSTLRDCGVLGVVSLKKLCVALDRSLHFLSADNALAKCITPKHMDHVSAALFMTVVTKRNICHRFRSVLQKQWATDKVAQGLIAQLPQFHQQEVTKVFETTMPTQEELPIFFESKRDEMGQAISAGSGIQTGDPNDVFFGLADSYNTAELTCVPIERKEKYHHTRGLVIGFLLDKRLLEFKDSTASTNEALVTQWIMQVLRSPLPVMCKEWFLMHLRTKAVWMPHLPPGDVATQQQRIIAHLLAWRCEVGSVREIIFAAFGDLPSHCVRSNRVYGVIAMFNPPVADWVNAGYDVQEHRFTDLPQDEEVFRTIVNKFNPMTTHVVVHGFDKGPMSDTLLKWLCEYTYRYPWRFFILVNCDTTTNLPENRDRVTNLMSLRNRQTETITLPVDEDAQRVEPFLQYLPRRAALQFETTRSCDWSEDLESCLKRVSHTNDALKDRVLLIHLISPPGGGKSTMLQALEKQKELGKFVRFDCSDDRLVEEALRALLDEVLAGVDIASESIVLVADEYHMLPDRKKEEFMQWAIDKLQRVRIVMIANRADPLDKKLLSTLRAAYPGCEESIKCVEGRISAYKVKVVIQNTYKLDEDGVNAQSKSFYTFLATLRGMLGDDAVSLRLEEHFPRVGMGKVNNYEFTKRLQDKLIAFGHDSILRILNSYEQISVLVDKETSGLDKELRRNKIVEMYKDCMGSSPIKLIVFTSMLVPLLWYEVPSGGTGGTVQHCDKTLCYRDVVELTGSLRRASTAVRLAMWVRYVVSFADVTISDDEHAIIFKTMQRLRLVDFPDFPIIQGESSLRLYPLHEQRSTFVNYHDLSDLDWIYRTLSRRVAVNWPAIKRTWELSPVTDSDKLCTIIDQAGPTTVFMALQPSNVLQLLKRNPNGPFTTNVIKSYPISRIKEESLTDESPYFFAAYSHLVSSEPKFEDLKKEFSHLLWCPRGVAEPKLAKDFLFWVSSNGSMVPSVPDRAATRSEAIVELIVKMSSELCFSTTDHANLWRGKYLAPAAELFGDEVIGIDGTKKYRSLISFRLAAEIAKGTSSQHKLHDKWPPTLKLVHRVVMSRDTILTVDEATHLLDMGILDQPVVPRLIGALLQADPPGWLNVDHQRRLLHCDVVIGADHVNADQKYLLHAPRNVMTELRKMASPSLITALKLKYSSITDALKNLTLPNNNTTIQTGGRAN